MDVASGELLQDEEGAHTGPVWAVAMRPDGAGFSTGGADKYVRMWEFQVDSADGSGSGSDAGKVDGDVRVAPISATIARQLQMTRDVLSLRYNYAKQAEKLMEFELSSADTKRKTKHAKHTKLSDIRKLNLQMEHGKPSSRPS